MHGGCLGTCGDMWERLGTPSDTWEQVGSRGGVQGPVGEMRGRSLKSIRSTFIAEIAKNFSCLEETTLEV